MELIILLFIAIFVLSYRFNTGDNVYKFFADTVSNFYNTYAPYSYREVREKTKELGQNYTVKDYALQIGIIGGAAALITYFYFYNLIVTAIYVTIAIAFVPYLSYLRTQRVYSEYVFEQIQVYTTNVIMEFATTQSFVKALEGVAESGVLEDPVQSDVKTMVELAYENGTIEEAIEFMNSKYDYYIVKNMHQLFLQITNEGSKNSSDALENMSLDIDMLVENVYRDRMDRAQFHKKFLQFGIILYLMVMLVQFLLGTEQYIKLLDENILVNVLLHGILLINSYFLLSGEKYYNENVGAE